MTYFLFHDHQKRSSTFLYRLMNHRIHETFASSSLFLLCLKKILQKTANEHAEERRISKDLISKNEK